VPRESPLLAWYGDDLTGSIDVLEGVTCAGLRAVLVLRDPVDGHLDEYRWAQAIGWAGRTRALDATAIRAAVGDAMAVMARSRARILQYKICSTFDSSPTVGSIGAAIDAAQAVVGSPFVPVMPGAPLLHRWVAFSNLFARSGPESEPYRLDLHPTMRTHPTTPMADSDLRTLLAEQTARPIGTVQLMHLQRGPAAVERRVDELTASGVDTIVCDSVDDREVALLAELVWRRSRDTQMLAVASSGLEHGLAEVWQLELGVGAPGPECREPEDVVLAVCGSRSPVTDAQIRDAIARGWVEVPLDLGFAARPDELDATTSRAAARAAGALQSGRSVVVHTGGTRLADGGDAVRIGDLDAAQRRRLGSALGSVAAAVLDEVPVRRLAIAGGDSSGDALRAMQVEALEVSASFERAMPFCSMHACGRYAGVEVICKGGQTGRRTFFEDVRRGRPAALEPQEVLV
jgi:3-oxoisoapionate kinase